MIADVEMTFDTKVGVSEVSALLEKAIQDGGLGEFQVSDVVVDSIITGELHIWLLSLPRQQDKLSGRVMWWSSVEK